MKSFLTLSGIIAQVQAGTLLVSSIIWALSLPTVADYTGPTVLVIGAFLLWGVGFAVYTEGRMMAPRYRVRRNRPPLFPRMVRGQTNDEVRDYRRANRLP